MGGLVESRAAILLTLLKMRATAQHSMSGLITGFGLNKFLGCGGGGGREAAS